MTGSVTRFLAVGIALSGAVLASVALPGTGSAQDAPSAPAVAAARAAVLPTAPALATAAAATGPTPTALPATAAPVRRPASTPARAAAAPRRAVTSKVPVARPAARAAASTCSGTGWQQRRGQAALRSLKPAAPAGYAVRFLGAKPGFYGLTRPKLAAVEVYVRSCSKETDALLRHVLAHELGHAYDLTRLTAAQRTAYKAARGIPASTPWYGCSRCTDFATPAGDFAEVYAQWRRGASSNRSQIGDAPSQARLDALATRFFGA